MTGRRSQARAIFLSVLMVMSVIAMGTAGFAGVAAANVDTITSVGADNVEVEQESITEQITLTGVDDDGTGDTITINTSSDFADASVTGVSVDSDGFAGDVTAEITDGDIVITIPDEAASEDVTLNVDYDTTGQAIGDVAVGVTATDGMYDDTVTVSFVAQDLDVELTPEPDTLFENDIESVSVTAENHPDGEEVSYEITADASEINSGTTDTDGSFSFTADPAGDGLSPGDAYDITVEYSELPQFDQDADATVTIVPEVNLDLQTNPQDPAFGDDVEFSGSFTDSDGDRPDNFESLKLNYTNSDGDATDIELTDLRVLSNGDIETRGGTVQVQDAGEYTVVYNDTNQDFELETFEVDGVEGNLQFEADDPVAGNEEPEAYNITVTDQNDEPLVLTETPANVDGEGSFEDTEGFVAVSGNFSADGVFTIEGEDATDGADELLRAVDEEGNVADDIDSLAGDTVVEFHVETTDSGELNFTAEAEDANSEITTNVAVRTDDGGTPGAADFANADEVAENVAVGGVENAFFFSPSALDITADADSVEVGAGDDINLNVDVTTLNVNVGGDIDIKVTGSDFQPAGADDSTLETANITISGDSLIGDDREIDIPNGEPEADFKVDDLEFTEAGELTVDVTAEDEDGTVFEASETLDVDGDLLLDLSPTEVDAGAEEDLVVQVGDSDGEIVFERTVTLDHTEADGFGEDGNQIELTSADYSTSQNAFVRENVSFELPGTIDLEVTDGGDTTVNVTEAISVEGDEKYELQTDEELLAGSTEGELNITVFDTQEGVVENDTDALDDIAATLEIGEFFDAGTDTVTVTDAENGTVTAVDVTADESGDINMTASTEGGAFTAAGEVSVVEPAITTSLGDDVLTEGVTTEDIFVEATDPRDGSTLGDADLEITATNTSFNVSWTAAPIDADETDVESLNADGNVTVDVTPDAIGEDPASLDLAVDVGADVGYFGDISIDAAELQLAEREDGQDVDLREEIAFDSEDDITFVLRDANDARLDARDVNVTGAGVDIQDVTDEGFFSIDFAEEELEEGETISFNSSSDFNGEITLATVDVTEDLEEVQLDLSVADDTVTQGDNLEFTVVRGDFQETTRADLTFTNASGDDILTVSTGAVDTNDYGVVDTSELEAGDYTVTAEKENSDAKTFLSDSVDVSVEEPDSSEIDVDVVDVDPNNASEGATYTVDATYSQAEGETAQFISVDFGTEDADFSAVVDDADNVAVSGPNGSSLDVAETLDADGTLVIQLGDSIADADVDDTYTVEVDEVVNADDGTYDLTLGLHEEGDEILDAAAAAFAADSDSYTIGEVDEVIVVGDSPATDTTGDGLLNDIDGDGEFDISDVQLFFENRDSDAVQNNVALFDFSDDGSIGIADVQALFEQLQNQ